MTEDWFEADTWPLEAAIAWLLYGDKSLCGSVAASALERRQNPSAKMPRLGIRLAVNEGLAATWEVHPGALYRPGLRKGWVSQKQTAASLFDLGVRMAANMMRGRRATGCPGDGARSDIPPRLWKISELIDHRSGFMLREKSGTTWRFIDVPAAPFRSLSAKRGRRPLGVSGQSPGGSMKTEERLRTKARHQNTLWGHQTPTERLGRPRDSKNIVH
jgi:hypothetical protein